ncbi:hypothetical protein MHLP_01380 [Candidatus Mycoplasma haematolamae str. Purdue]|uniref:Ig-like domain-containing protein n=1 Tax=Mycoplasma haematolamae (strain Purdue) TaxID=1212765 RepID=I7CF18_MYCHA|nr:hypothetical protein [Candidatus Mycoplasma haematolamae]AFO51856.1 hypothetical protein MHLP_01380 [Candidatus Mycoplasma haematolamae str. Purdue]
MIREIFTGLGTLGAMGGIGTAGVLYGPTAWQYAQGYLSMFKEAEVGKGIKYTVRFDGTKKSQQDISCQGKDSQHTSLKLEKVEGQSEGNPRAKLVCQNTSQQLEFMERFIKSSKDVPDLTCVRESSEGETQTFRCAIKGGKELTLGTETEPKEQKQYSKVVAITLSW